MNTLKKFIPAISSGILIGSAGYAFYSLGVSELIVIMWVIFSNLYFAVMHVYIANDAEKRGFEQCRKIALGVLDKEIISSEVKRKIRQDEASEEKVWIN